MLLLQQYVIHHVSESKNLYNMIYPVYTGSLQTTLTFLTGWLTVQGNASI